MRIAELAERSGVAVATIKYYIREGLLPRGERTAPNQAEYDQRHVQRLQLIRSLREVADLSIDTIGQTLAAIDDADREPVEGGALAIAIRALTPADALPDDDPELAEAGRVVDDLLADLGWEIPEDSPSRAALVRAVAGIARYWVQDPSVEGLRPYADVAERLARHEVPEDFDPRAAPADALRWAVLGTVLFEPVLTSLRRLAHIDRSRRLRSVRRGDA